MNISAFESMRYSYNALFLFLFFTKLESPSQTHMIFVIVVAVVDDDCAIAETNVTATVDESRGRPICSL